MIRRIVIDCDPGTDDAIALWLALASPEVELAMVSVVGGNVGLDVTLPNALAIVGLAGRGDIPVVAGAARALLGGFPGAAEVHGEDGLGGVLLPEGPPVAPGLAADRIRELLRGSGPDSVTLVGIGPATNLALVVATEPALLDRVAEIVLMTGAMREGNITPSAEFNAYCDPEALAVLLGCGRPVTLATLDVTNQALCTPARIAALRASGGGACARAVADIWDRVAPSARSDHAGHEQHDPCALAWLIAPHLFTARDVFAEVDCGVGPGRGRTVIDRWRVDGRAPNTRLLETVDADGFFALLTERLPRLP